MKSKIPIFIFVLLVTFISDAIPDMVRLKNGRSIQGLIEKETEEGIWLDLGIGTVKFRWEEIDKIDRSGIEETGRIRQEWQRQKALAEKEVGSKEKKVGPNEVGFSRKGGHIFVNALLNNKVNAMLILDTGSPGVLLSEHITKELGINTHGLKIRTTAVAGTPDLQVVDTVLNSIKVEGVEAKDVDAELSLDEIPRLEGDGLLGMSFLKRFKFQIDSVNKKLILEEKKSQNVLEKTKYFNVIVPSDWGTAIDEENLTVKGPNLIVKKGAENPYIVVKKNTDEQALSHFETMKKIYDYFKNSSDMKHEISEWLRESFKKSYPQDKYEPVSFDFEEKKAFVMLHETFVYKENGARVKWYRVTAITKSEPARSYDLSYSCIEQYFDKFLSVFKACLKSFVISGY